MSCDSTITKSWQSTPPESTADDNAAVHICDRQRPETQNLLGQALATGYLSMAEFEARLDLVSIADTSADLAAVLADLPVAGLRATDPANSRTASARRGLRVHTAAYMAGILLKSLVWLIVTVSASA